MKLEISSQIGSYVDGNAISKGKENQNNMRFLDVMDEKNKDFLSEEDRDENIEELLSSIMNLINNISNIDTKEYSTEDSNVQNKNDNNLLDSYVYSSIDKTKNFLVGNSIYDIDNIYKEMIGNNYFTENELTDNNRKDIIKAVFERIENNKFNANQGSIIFDFEKDNSEIGLIETEDIDFTELDYTNNYTHKDKQITENSRLVDEYNDKDLKILQSIAKKDENNNGLFVNNDIFNIRNNIGSIKPESKQVITARENFLAEDIVKSINFLQSNDMKELRVNLSPKELGDMMIKIIKSEKESRLLITVSKEDIFNLVAKNIDEINKHLSDMDIRVKDIEVEIKSDNQNDFSDNFNHEFKEENNKKFYYEADDNQDSADILEDEKIQDENINLLA